MTRTADAIDSAQHACLGSAPHEPPSVCECEGGPCPQHDSDTTLPPIHLNQPKTFFFFFIHQFPPRTFFPFSKPTALSNRFINITARAAHALQYSGTRQPPRLGLTSESCDVIYWLGVQPVPIRVAQTPLPPL